MTIKGLDTPMPYEEHEHEGDLLVFLHGFPNNYKLWRPQIDVLRNHFHILNFNLPGSYCGGVRDRKFFRTHYIQDTIVNVMKERMRPSGKRAWLVGHDLGCFILDEVGKQMSAHVKGQVLLSGMGLKLYLMKAKEPSQMMKSWYVGALQLPGAPTFVKKILQKKMKRQAYQMSNIREDSPLYTEAPHGFEPIYLYQELAKKALHLRTPRERSTIPTLFVFGKADRFLNAPTQPEVDLLYEKASVQEIDGGHWINREKIEEVDQILKSFLGVP